MWISCNAGTSGCPTNCRQGQTTTPCRSASRNRDPNLLPGQLHSTPNLSEYVCHAWRPQPGIASDLLEDDDTLRAIRPPPTDEDRSVLGAEEIAALFAARAVHYGHEDVMHHQFTVRPPPPPPRSPGFVPWRGAKMEGAPSEVAQHAAALAAAEVEAANDVPRGGRLRTIVFSDGSSREVM